MKSFYRRKLPHWIPPEATFFVTFRLANSLPAAVLAELLAEKERQRQAIEQGFVGQERKNKLYQAEKKWFGHFDAWLDRCLAENPHWLAEDKIARIVADAIHEFDGKRYTLLAYCIMPNHVHLLMDTQEFRLSPSHQGCTAPYPLTDTLKRLKGRTARYANQALGRSGAFWQHESYDHVVQDAKELERVLWYILNNPVKAGLVTDWRDWPHTWTSFDESVLAK